MALVIAKRGAMQAPRRAARGPRAALRKERADFCLKAADMHLLRVGVLADTEWKVSILYWGALLTSGAALISYAGNSEPPIAGYISHYDWVFLLAYIASAVVFLFGFSINQARVLVAERSRYQFFQNEAAREYYPAQSGYFIRTAGHSLPGTDSPGFGDILRNRVWGSKVITTCLIVSTIWITSQVLANARSDLAQATLGTLRVQTLSIEFGKKDHAVAVGQPLTCAFFNCHDDYRWDGLRTDPPETGTTIWLVFILAMLGLGANAIIRGRH